MPAEQEPAELAAMFRNSKELGVQVRFGEIATESHTWAHLINFGSFGHRGS
jgi:hypothetical protein